MSKPLHQTIAVSKVFAVSSDAVDYIAAAGAKLGLAYAFRELSSLATGSLPDALRVRLENLLSEVRKKALGSSASTASDGDIQHALDRTRSKTHRRWVEQVITIRDTADRRSPCGAVQGSIGNG